MVTRTRLRQVSPERIAKVAEALQARGVVCAIKLGTDGSAVLTPAGGESLTIAPESDANEWDRALGIQ